MPSHAGDWSPLVSCCQRISIPSESNINSTLPPHPPPHSASKKFCGSLLLPDQLLGSSSCESLTSATIGVLQKERLCQRIHCIRAHGTSRAPICCSGSRAFAVVSCWGAAMARQHTGLLLQSDVSEFERFLETSRVTALQPQRPPSLGQTASCVCHHQGQ